MTNYEKYKEEIINMLLSDDTCIKLAQLRYGKLKCKKQTCKECINEQRQWLNEEAKEFDPNKLKEGDKIVMRNHENTEFSEYEVICNRFPCCWLRFTGLENNKAKPDKGFLISYDKLMSEYDVIEAFRE